MYLIIDTVRDQEYEPGYYSREPGGYVGVERIKVSRFTNEEAFTKALQGPKPSNLVTRELFSAEELVAETKVTYTTKISGLKR